MTQRMWAVKRPMASLNIVCVKPSAKEARFTAIAHVGVPSWKDLYSAGYRCVRVVVTEEQ